MAGWDCLGWALAAVMQGLVTVLPRLSCQDLGQAMMS